MTKDLTRYQRGIVNRYYEHKGTIHATRLGEIVSDLSVESDAKKLDRLWKSAGEYLAKCGVDAATIEATVPPRNIKLLGEIAGAVMTGGPIPRARPKA
ncbi:MAG: hypothetical protein KF678_13200 [Phycisphaeraceae bacterium]|nr:hypothetical protein [Phycisphaeraceae bacterium]